MSTSVKSFPKLLVLCLVLPWLPVACEALLGPLSRLTLLVAIAAVTMIVGVSLVRSSRVTRARSIRNAYRLDETGRQITGLEVLLGRQVEACRALTAQLDSLNTTTNTSTAKNDLAWSEIGHANLIVRDQVHGAMQLSESNQAAQIRIFDRFGAMEARLDEHVETCRTLATDLEGLRQDLRGLDLTDERYAAVSDVLVAISRRVDRLAS